MKRVGPRVAVAAEWATSPRSGVLTGKPRALRLCKEDLAGEVTGQYGRQEKERRGIETKEAVLIRTHFC